MKKTKEKTNPNGLRVMETKTASYQLLLLQFGIMCSFYQRAKEQAINLLKKGLKSQFTAFMYFGDSHCGKVEKGLLGIMLIKSGLKAAL